MAIVWLKKWRGWCVIKENFKLLTHFNYINELYIFQLLIDSRCYYILALHCTDHSRERYFSCVYMFPSETSYYLKCNLIFIETKKRRFFLYFLSGLLAPYMWLQSFGNYYNFSLRKLLFWLSLGLVKKGAKKCTSSQIIVSQAFT